MSLARQGYRETATYTYTLNGGEHVVSEGKEYDNET